MAALISAATVRDSRIAALLKPGINVVHLLRLEDIAHLKDTDPPAV